MFTSINSKIEEYTMDKKSNDILIMPLGIETPIIHTISVDDTLFNVGIGLKSITLLGSSIESASSEYRHFNLNNNRIQKVINGSVGNKTLDSFYTRLKTIVVAHTKSHTISIDSHKLKNITADGITYALFYFLLLKRFHHTEDQFISLNEFSVITPILSIFNNILNKSKPTAIELQSFADYILEFDDINYSIGSKLLPISRSQVENSTDLYHSLWKSMYINKLIRNIPMARRQTYVSPSVDWGVLNCSTKDVFTNTQLVSKVIFGENIRFIQNSSLKQKSLASDLIKNFIHINEIESIKELTSKLNEITNGIDYHYGDHAIVVFYLNMGNTLLDEANSAVFDKSKAKNLVFQSITDFQLFKQMIFQYLYCVLLLAEQGIIHRDPHLNNILISKSEKQRRLEYALPSGRVVDIGSTMINITMIDFDKSILSHRHHNHFDQTSRVINEEMAIVFDMIKRNISDDYDQIFNCVVMYDVIKFVLVMQRLLDDFMESTLDVSPHRKFLEEITKLATDTMFKIYDESPSFPFNHKLSHGSIEWLILALFKSNIKANKTKSSLYDAIHATKIKSTLSHDLPDFVSSKRKYANLLKQNYIAKLASTNK